MAGRALTYCLFSAPCQRWSAQDGKQRLQGVEPLAVVGAGDRATHHQVREAERTLYRAQRKTIPDEVVLPYPMPDAIGLAIDPISGEDLQKLAADIFATPLPFVEKVKDALVYRAP